MHNETKTKHKNLVTLDYYTTGNYRLYKLLNVCCSIEAVRPVVFSPVAVPRHPLAFNVHINTRDSAEDHTQCVGSLTLGPTQSLLSGHAPSTDSVTCNNTKGHVS